MKSFAGEWDGCQEAVDSYGVVGLGEIEAVDKLYAGPCFVAFEVGWANCDGCRVVSRTVKVVGANESLGLRGVQEIVVLRIATDTNYWCRALNIPQIFEQII